MIIKNQAELEAYRALSKIHLAIMAELKSMLAPGVTGRDVEKRTDQLCLRYGVDPAFKGAYNFPASLCVSVNQCVVHGVPNDKPFMVGDVIKIDFGAHSGGLNTDSAFSVQVGDPKNPEMERFLMCNEECLERGVAKAVAGNTNADVGRAIEAHAKAMGYYVVRTLTGHGLERGRGDKAIHAAPHMYNYDNSASRRTRESCPVETLLEGMVVAIEPILGHSCGTFRTGANGFDFIISNGSVGSQFEHLLVVGKGSSEILV